MTAIYKCIEKGKVGLRRGRKPTLPFSHNSLIVISNEVRNLSVTYIMMILPDDSVLKTDEQSIEKKKLLPYPATAFIKFYF